MGSVSEVRFESGGLACSADLYLPAERRDRVGCVILGHGGSGTKRLGLPRYAERFADRGMAALAFDYRHFGESEGQPRQLIDVESQREDYAAAVRYARRLPGVDPERVALWGTSLSGGHVLAVAASDPRLCAVVAQVPLIDGWHRGRTLRQRFSREIVGRTVRLTVAAVEDVLNARRGRAPRLVPVVGSGQLAVFTEPGARAAFERLGGEGVGWRNELAPRSIFALPRYRTGTAERIDMPVLMCLADHDLEASSRYAAGVATRIPDVHIRHYPVGHFDVYLDLVFDEISAVQADFLADQLCRSDVSSPGRPGLRSGDPSGRYR